MDRQHWEDVYASKGPAEVSWTQGSLEPSLQRIRAAGLSDEAAIVDVGGGFSCLAGELIDLGFSDITVVDLAQAALDAARSNLGGRATPVRFLRADVTQWRPDRVFDLWHDRAVFHFLTEPADRARYIAALEVGLKPGGRLVLAAFAPDGPERCSGLPVRRWAAEALAAELGSGFELIEDAREEHHTPWGSVQPFTWTTFRRA
jgi:trans-aconitate methyltransferase